MASLILQERREGREGRREDSREEERRGLYPVGVGGYALAVDYLTQT
jgi:hypothetical protein